LQNNENIKVESNSYVDHQFENNNNIIHEKSNLKIDDYKYYYTKNIKFDTNLTLNNSKIMKKKS
jgi:hypothetical protein